MTDLRLALLSSCTSDLLRQPLTAALNKYSIEPSIWMSGYAQYRQDVLNPASALYEQQPAVILLYLDGADLFAELLDNAFDTSPERRRDMTLGRASETATLVETLAERLPRTTVLLNTVAVDPRNALVGLEYNSDQGIQDAVTAYNRELGALAQRRPTVAIVDVASLAAAVGFENWYDPRMWYLARSRWSRRAMDVLAARYAAAISSFTGRVCKCIVVDLDNTLWGGIAGEDGLEGITLSEEGIGRPFVEFQLELLNLHRKGVLLAISSKNNPDDAFQIIRRHPSMRLREQHFAAVRINWGDKAVNVRAIAQDLNIGLDSIVFLDDSAVERSRVRQALPEVLVPEWPADPGYYKTALLELAAQHFYKTRITAEDRRAGEAYRSQAERRRLEDSAGSIEEFYASLGMQARIGRADSFTIPRIAQLTQKTNQFNLTTRRYSEAEISSMSQDPDCAIWWLELSDRFGPNGVVGVLILRRHGFEAWGIDTFLLSCRVMGRAVENAFLAAVVHEMGAGRLVGEYRPTAKNKAVCEVYRNLGFLPLREESGGQLWELRFTGTELRVPAWFDIEFAASGLVAAGG